MNIAKAAGMAAVLTLAAACASTGTRSTDAQPQVSPGGATTTPGGAAGVPTAGLERYVGEYDFSGFTMTIRLRGDALIHQVEGQPDQPLKRISENRFRIGTTSMELVFIVDRGGQVTQLLMGAGSHQARGFRIR